MRERIRTFARLPAVRALAIFIGVPALFGAIIGDWRGLAGWLAMWALIGVALWVELRLGDPQRG